jgi:hypothetical protein
MKKSITLVLAVTASLTLAAPASASPSMRTRVQSWNLRYGNADATQLTTDSNNLAQDSNAGNDITGDIQQWIADMVKCQHQPPIPAPALQAHWRLFLIYEIKYNRLYLSSNGTSDGNYGNLADAQLDAQLDALIAGLKSYGIGGAW